MKKPMENLIDAFLYLGSTQFRLKEQMPADIALMVDERMELLRQLGKLARTSGVGGELSERHPRDGDSSPRWSRQGFPSGGARNWSEIKLTNLFDMDHFSVNLLTS
jgi:hypothetical protein